MMTSLNLKRREMMKHLEKFDGYVKNFIHEEEDAKYRALREMLYDMRDELVSAMSCDGGDLANVLDMHHEIQEVIKEKFMKYA